MRRSWVVILVLAVVTAAVNWRVSGHDLTARGDRAYILPLAGRPAEAIAEYQEILRQQPEWPEVPNNLAWMQATYPQDNLRDSAKAVRLTERAVEFSGHSQPVYFGTLAAACAEAGRFDDAIKAGENARDLASTQGLAEIAKTNDRLLIFYCARRPYRREPL